MGWFRRNWVFIAAFVVVNLAIAAPAGAMKWKNDMCDDGQGGVVPCCSTCFLIGCRCDYPPE